MAEDDDILKRLAGLDDARLQVVADNLAGPKMQRLVLQAATRGGESLETVRRMVDLRETEELPAEPEVLADGGEPPEPTTDATLISWDQLAALIGNDTILDLCDGLFGILEPWQRDLDDSVVDAFGIDLVGAKQLIEANLPIDGVDFKAIHEENLADGDMKVEFDPQGLNFIWFTRGPYVRRRPYVYVITGGRVAIGGNLSEDIPHTVSPYVAHYDGPDDEITPESWTEWFADAGIGRDNSSFRGANLSMSYFESASGPADVVGIVQERLEDVVAPSADDAAAARRASGKWKGLSLEFSQGKGGASRTAGWLGSLFYR